VRLSRLSAWGALLAYMGVIFYLSHQSTLPVPMAFPNQDKLMHFGAYAILGALASHAFTGAGLRGALWWAIAFASAYGVSDEFHQSFVPGRSVDFFDWVADTLGAAAGTAVYARIAAARYREAEGPSP